MPKTVIKRSGEHVEFDKSKIERWAEYATQYRVDWHEIVDQVIERLPETVSSEDIHYTMINVCLFKEDIKYSRVAARLLYAELRKNMAIELDMTDKTGFVDIHAIMTNSGLWQAVPYDAIMESQYRELMYLARMEYWQIKQWMDKYSLKINDNAIETPYMAAMAIGYSLFPENHTRAFDTAKAIVSGKLNLPTPVLNGIRNGDWDTISCSVIEGGDSIPSIGVADHMAYRMTAKKAGIGIRMNTRAKGLPVKGGAVKHLGKLPIYATIDKSVKMFTQVTRGGSATVTFSVYDPEVMEIIMVKSQRTPENVRIDKLDYSMAYDNDFVRKVINDEEIQTYSYVNATYHAGPKYNAREVLKAYLTVRKETGRLYCINIDTVNDHSPFIDTIVQSNLCMEIALPTYPYYGMEDLYGKQSMGEVAFCTLAAVNVQKTKPAEYEHIADLAIRILNRLIDMAPMFADSLKRNLINRRSLGIGITGLAGNLFWNMKSYDDTDYIEELAERHYYYLLKASQKYAAETGVEVDGINNNWLPIDTKRTHKEPSLDWEALRGKPRANSVLVAHMPTESSAVFSDATNGLYPIRRQVIGKQSRKGNVQYIAPPCEETAWNLSTETLTNAYAAVQAYTDQSISADFYVGSGKVSMGQMMKDFIQQSNAGLKTAYYLNTNDDNGGMFEEEACEGGCKL